MENERGIGILETYSLPETDPLLPQTPAPKPARQWRRRAMLMGGVALAAAALITWRIQGGTPAAPYGKAPIRRQTIARTISATGTLQALTTVQVGTQVSGTIAELYADYNSRVQKGQVIARLDPSQLQAQLAQSNAALLSAQSSVQSAQNNVLSAEAGVQSAQANIDRLDAVLTDAQKTLNRTKLLIQAGAAPAMNLDTAESAVSQAAAQKQQGIAQLNQSKAQAQAARSQVSQAQAQAAQAKASVDVAQVNLDHTIIRAPIDGVVVARNVDVGQTVAASLQAPTVFLIANDLTRMQVLANIDEADVGQLSTGVAVTFTVDAYPNDTFRGSVSQVRLAPQTVQNVVTYTAVIDVPNPDQKLKPGMTASVTATVAKRENVLAVPASALRFRPESADPQPAAGGARRRNAGPVVWKIEGDKLTPVPIQLGLTDGVRFEVVSGDLKEGDQVATPAATAAAAQQSGRSPSGSSPFRVGGGGRGGR